MRTGCTVWLLSGVLAVGILCAFFVLWDLFQYQGWVAQAGGLKVGDSKETVRRIMGEPLSIREKDWQMIERDLNTLPPHPGLGEALLFGKRPEEWIYGRRMATLHEISHARYFFPLRIRLFGAESDDLAITFDEQGRVSSVNMPE